MKRVDFVRQFARLAAVSITGLFALVASNAQAQPENILRQRSAQDNVVFGRIVDINESRLRVMDGETLRTYQIGPQTVIEIDGQPRSLSDLPAEGRLRIRLEADAPDRVNRIVLQRPGEPPSTVGTPTPSVLIEHGQAEGVPDAAQVDGDPVSEAPIGARVETTPRGILVVEVVDDGPAARAALRAGDVIKRVNGQNLASARGLHRLLHQFPARETLEVTFVREEQERTTRLILPDQHVPQLVNRPVSGPAPALGARQILSEAQLGWVLADRNGAVVVVSVDPETPAELSDIQIGDELVRIAGLDVRGAEETLQLIQSQARGASVALQIRRGGKLLTRGLMLPTSSPLVVNKVPAGAATEEGEAPIVAGDGSIERLMRQQQEQQHLLMTLLQEIKALREELAAQRPAARTPPDPAR